MLRSEFDQLLLDNAREKGADVHEETTVREGIWENGGVVGVKAVTKDGTMQEFRAPITIDATGRDAFFITRSGWKIRDPYLNKIAVWTYYKGAKRDSGYDEGATTVAYVPDKGWFWYIPQADDIVSVGRRRRERLSLQDFARTSKKSSTSRWSRTSGSRIISRSASSSDRIVSPANIPTARAIAEPKA